MRLLEPMNGVRITCEFSELVPTSGLNEHPRNRNTHSSEQIDRLVLLIRHHGFRHPILVSKLSGLVVAGHGRLLAARKIGMESIPVDYQEFSDADAEYAFLISDNAIAAWAELDLSEIKTDLGDLGPEFDLDLLGLKDLGPDITQCEPQGDPDDVPDAPAEPRTKRGDLYQLGRHRLLCGDSTSIDEVERLMGGEKADLWLTDPPYGVSYRSNGAEDKHEKIANDDLPIDEMAEFWTTVAGNALISCSDKAPYYWFACQGGDQMMMMMSISRAGWKVRHELIWVKDSLVMGRCDYHYKHEPILYGWKQDGTHEWHSDRKQTSVLEFPRPKKSEDHPTMKPVELVEYLMGNNTRPRQVVLDTFGGSGTTLIAAEKSNRDARLIEISQKYCDVIVSRYLKYVGKTKVIRNGEEIDWNG